MARAKPKSMPADETAAGAQEALQKALQYLARREYYTEELKRRLTRGGYREQAVDEVLTELTTSGRLSDARYVEAYVAERRRRLYGPRRILLELMNKGFDEGAARRALDAGDAGDDDWFEAAQRCLRKRFGEASAAPADVNRAEYAKRRNYLHRRGYPADVIRMVLPDAPGS